MEAKLRQVCSIRATDVQYRGSQERIEAIILTNDKTNVTNC